MRRRLPALGLLAALLALCAMPARAQGGGEAQSLVDRATLTVQEVLAGGDAAAQNDAIRLLARARAVVVCPRIFRAGFIFAAEGGDCVMVARDAAGSWSSPAFYTMASGSLGFQIGVQDMQVLMLVMSDRGLGALLDSQFKFGADASVAIATVGAGIEGSTTSAAGADIVAFARSRGLFAGVALEGSLLSARSDLNRAFYGQDVSARQVVVAMQAHNPGADPLRAVLMRFGSSGGGPPPAAPAYQEPPPAAPPPMGGYPGQPRPYDGVQSAPLPPIAGAPR
jgi:lipid-binding SYLF domain-containing protein